MKIHRALVFAALVAPAAGGAQGVHKCVDAEGHAKYTQGPCRSEALAPKKAPAPAAEPAPPEPRKKFSPEQRAQSGPAPKADPDAEKPLVDSMGRPDVTRM